MKVGGSKLKFQQIASGSSGNMYIVTATNGNRLIIECGIPKNEMLKGLRFNSKGIEGCFISHLHKDHSKSIKDVLRSGIDVFANKSTLESHKLLNTRRAKVIDNKTLIKTKSFTVLCFDVNHDVPTLGFMVNETATNEKLLFATDTSHISQRFKWAFDIIAMECNYDKDILNRAVENESIHESHAKRLLESHMEKSETMRYIKEFVNTSKLRELHLLHLSDGNIDAEKTQQRFKDKFFIDTKIVGD